MIHRMRLRRRTAQLPPADESAHTGVAVREPVVVDQVLPVRHRAAADPDRGLDDLAIGLAGVRRRAAARQNRQRHRGRAGEHLYGRRLAERRGPTGRAHGQRLRRRACTGQPTRAGRRRLPRWPAATIRDAQRQGLAGVSFRSIHWPFRRASFARPSDQRTGQAGQDGRFSGVDIWPLGVSTEGQRQPSPATPREQTKNSCRSKEWITPGPGEEAQVDDGSGPAGLSYGTQHVVLRLQIVWRRPPRSQLGILTSSTPRKSDPCHRATKRTRHSVRHRPHHGRRRSPHRSLA